MKWIHSLGIAFSMYSKIPVPKVRWTNEAMQYTFCFFPLVGVAEGALLWGMGMVLYGLRDRNRLPAIFVAIVRTILPLLVTGGIHLDGFADTVDALSSYGDREKKLEILKDPNTGAFAVIGLCVYFLADVALWSEVTEELLPVIACTYMLSRSLSGISVVSFQAAKNSGLLRTFQDGAQKFRVRVVLILWACACGGGMLILSWRTAVIVIPAALLVFLYYYRMSRKQFGGITGDLAGYFLQVCELAMLAGAVLSRGIG